LARSVSRPMSRVRGMGTALATNDEARVAMTQPSVRIPLNPERVAVSVPHS
jgi:hypothetical protein